MRIAATTTILSLLLLAACEQPDAAARDPLPPTRFERMICPEGTAPIGHAPPLGTELACALPDGARHGPYSRWYPDGKLAESGPFARGVKQGLWQTYYHRTGRKKSEGLYADGLREGPWAFYNKRGKIKEEARFERGALTDMKKYGGGP